MEDEQIIALYFSRDELAIRETDEKYGRLCFQIANHLLQSPQDCEECVNDAYSCLWKQIPPQHPQCLMAFLGKITRNLALKRLEYASAAKRSPDAVISLSELEEVLPDRQPADSAADDASIGRLIDAFLRQQKADVRNVFLRRYWFFDSVSEIAARYHFSESKVKSILFRTRSKLRQYLKKEGVDV